MSNGNGILLSICIPTFNRPTELRHCLDVLLDRIGTRTDVEICINDNASPYDFDALVAEYRARFPRLIARRNPENLGMGANFLKVVELANGEYAWLVSDDDELVPGAIDRIAEVCAERRYDLIIPDREYRKPDLSYDYGRRVSNLTARKEYADPSQLLIDALLDHYSYVGCLVVKVASWRRVDGEKYIRLKYFPHCCMVAEAMWPNGRAVLLPDALIHVRGGHFSWEKNAAAVWFFHLAENLEPVPGYAPDVKRRALWRMMRQIGPYAAWLCALHGRRVEALKLHLAATTRDLYRRLGAMDVWAAGLVLLTGATVPTPVLRGSLGIYRRLAALRATR